MTRLWRTGLLEAMLLVALAGAGLCVVLHVASLCGYTVVRGIFHVVVTVSEVLTFCVGMFAHHQMGNASKVAHGIRVSFGSMANLLTRLEYTVFLIVLAYAFVAAAILWPWPRTKIQIIGHPTLSLADARALWPVDLALFATSAALLQSARV